jgi:hypothetical protein
VGELKADRLVVVGQGYAGLPVAMRAVEVGFDVVGFDLDVARVKRLGAGDSFVEDITSDDVVKGTGHWAVRAHRRPWTHSGIRRGRHRRPHAPHGRGTESLPRHRATPRCWPARCEPEPP